MVSGLINFLQSSRTQIISVLVTSAYITTLLLITYNSHIYREPIDALILPSPVTEALANNIEVGVHFNAFPYMSFKTGTFTIDATVWFKFDQGTESIETFEGFTIKNMLVKQEGKTFYRSKPMVKIIGEQVMVSYHIQATFMSEMAYKKFPIGDHRVNIQLENRNAGAREVLFNIKPENVTFSENLLLGDWQPLGAYANAGIVEVTVGSGAAKTMITYPGVNIAVDFENVGMRSLISMYFPLFVLFFIGLLSLSLGIFDTSRLGIIASALPSLVLFRLVIDSVSPEVGYATHIDFVYYVLVALSFFILFFQTYVVILIEKTKNYAEAQKEKIKERLEGVNGLLFMGLLIALIIIMTYDFFH